MKTFRILMFVTLLLLFMAGLSSLALANNQPRITKHIDDSQLSIMRGNTRPEAMNRKNDRGPVADSLALDHIMLQLGRSPQQEQKFEKLIDQMSNHKNSANYHQWLTADQIGEKFGVAQEDMDAITGWLQYHGFQINQIYPATMMIDFAGTAGQVREAFHTSIHNIDVNGEQHIANMSDPMIPDALSPVVKGIVSLHNFMPKPMYLAKTPDMTFAGCTSSATLKASPGKCYSMTPNDTAVEYNLNPLFTASTPITGTGQVIAVVEDSDTYDTTGSGTEWTTYRNAFGLNVTGPSGSYVEAHPGGCTDPGHNADDGEAAIDVEMATTTAPNAEIELISCPSGAITFGGLLALQGLVSGAAPYPGVISISYGVDEGSNGNAGNLAFYSVYQSASAEGITVFGASGDNGPSAAESGYAADPTYGDLAALSVSGWTETPYNVSVGGTDFEDVYNSKETNTLGGFSGTVPLTNYWATSNTSTYGSALQYVPEIPWNDSCASVLISEVVDNTFAPYGTGTCNASTYDTTKGYMSEAAGSGGPSNCALLNGGSIAGTEAAVDPDCMGYPKPGFQSGSSLTGGLAVYGQNSDQVRDTPDIALFASNGVWGHYQTVCYNDPTETAEGAIACTGAPSTWSGFGGTSVAAPTMAGIQSLINQQSGTTWGIGALTNYYNLGASEYGTAGGTFAGGSCNSNGSGGPGSSCVWNDVTQGDISLPCFDNYSQSECYKSSSTQTHGVTVTDSLTATDAAVIFGGSGYTTIPTCTVAGPSNSNPYTAPSGTVLYAGGTQATCTATTSSGTTTAVWKATFLYSTTDEQGIEFVIASPSGASATTYTMPSCATTTACATALASGMAGNAWATCAGAAAVTTCTATTTGDAGNFVLSYGNAGNGTEFQEELAPITNTTKGQGPNYVASIAIGTGGSGYGPDAAITISGGGGADAVAVANTIYATAPQTAAAGYQPSYGAAPGWDMATGLGSPNATNLVCNAIWADPVACPLVYGQTITVTTAAPGSAAYNSTFNVAATASSTLAVAITSSGSCSGSGSGSATITMTSGTGTCTVDYNQAGGTVGSTTYSAAPQVQSSTTASKLANTVTFTTPAPSTAAYGSSFTVAASGLGTGAISYTNGGVCTNGGTATYTMTSGTGSCTVTATQAADSNYASANASEGVTATLATDTVTFTTPAPGSAEYGSSFTVAASGLGTGAISYTSGGACSNSSATYTMTSGTGNCTVTATQAADSNYASGNSSESVTAEPAVGSVSVVLTSGSNPSLGGQSVSFTATVSSDTGAVKGRKTIKKTTKRPKDLNGTVAWSGWATASTDCPTSSVSGNSPETATCTTTNLPVGSDTVTATYTASDSNHTTGSGSVSQTVNAAGNSITFTTPPPSSAEYGSSFTVAASGQGTGAITYTSDGVVCSNSGATYTMISGSGTCSVTATQAADGIYPTASATDYVTAEPAVGSVSVLLTSGSNPSTYGDSITFTATVTSDTGAVKGRKTTKRPKDLNGSVAWSGNTGCASSSVSGNSGQTATCTTSTLAVPGGTVTATYTANDANHTTASGSVSQTVNQAANTVTFTTPAPSSAEYGSSFTVAASGLGTGAITYTSDGVVCSNSGATYTMISGTGTCTVTATQAADTNYASANASESVTAAPAVGSVSVTLTSGSNPSNYGDSIIFTATVSSDTGAVKGRKTTKRPKDLNGSVAWSGNTGCSASAVSGNSPETATCTTSLLGAGSDTVTASYTASDSNHTSGSGSVSQTVSQASQTINVTTAAPSSAAYNTTFPVAANATSSLPVSIASTGSCTGSGSGTANITMNSGTGSCLVTFSQAGNSNYAAASNVNESTNATLGTNAISCSTGAPSTAIDGSSFTLVCSAQTAISYGASGSCTNSGATYTMTVGARVNTYCDEALTAAGNANYATATPVNTQTKVVAPATPTETFVNDSTSPQMYGATFNVTATTNESGTISTAVITTGTPDICSIGASTVSGGGTIVTAPVTMLVGSGSCHMQATWPINTEYKGEHKNLVVVASKVTPTATFTGAPADATNGGTFTVTATSNETTGTAATPVIKATPTTVCTIGSATQTGPGTYQATVTMIKATGTCTTKATWATTTDYDGVPAISQTTAAN